MLTSKLTTRSKATAIGLILVVALSASACIAIVNHAYQYDIPFGVTLRVVIFERATFDMANLHNSDGRNSEITANVLNNVALSGMGAAEWHDLMQNHKDDVGAQLSNILDWAPFGPLDCFGFNKNLITGGLDAVTVNAPEDSRCQFGEPFQQSMGPLLLDRMADAEFAVAA